LAACHGKYVPDTPLYCHPLWRAQGSGGSADCHGLQLCCPSHLGRFQTERAHHWTEWPAQQARNLPVQGQVACAARFVTTQYRYPLIYCLRSTQQTLPVLNLSWQCVSDPTRCLWIVIKSHDKCKCLACWSWQTKQTWTRGTGSASAEGPKAPVSFVYSEATELMPQSVVETICSYTLITSESLDAPEMPVSLSISLSLPCAWYLISSSFSSKPRLTNAFSMRSACSLTPSTPNLLLKASEVLQHHSTMYTLMHIHWCSLLCMRLTWASSMYSWSFCQAENIFAQAESKGRLRHVYQQQWP